MSSRTDAVGQSICAFPFLPKQLNSGKDRRGRDGGDRQRGEDRTIHQQEGWPGRGQGRTMRLSSWKCASIVACAVTMFVCFVLPRDCRLVRFERASSSSGLSSRLCSTRCAVLKHRYIACFVRRCQVRLFS